MVRQQQKISLKSYTVLSSVNSSQQSWFKQRASTIPKHGCAEETELFAVELHSKILSHTQITYLFISAVDSVMINGKRLNRKL